MNSFWHHFEELRKTLLRIGWVLLAAFVLCFCFHKSLLAALLAPLGIEELYLFSPLEGFMIALKISFWGGLLLASPLIIGLLLLFLLPALKHSEKKMLLPFLSLSLLFVSLGILFAYKITLPFVSNYFYSFNAELGTNLWSLKESVSLSLGLISAHALVFELYVILLFLIHFGFLTYSLLKKIRKGVIVAIFILAAILTPPDVASQLLLAFPMLVLFESAIFYARFKKKPIKSPSVI